MRKNETTKAPKNIDSIMSMKALRAEMEKNQHQKKQVSKSPPNHLIYLGKLN